MCHEGRHHGQRGFRRGFRTGRYDREQMLERLEGYQRDLEQELADVSDLVKRLKEEQPKETATV
jgi:hypothetical protein